MDVRAKAEIIPYCLQGISKIVLRATLLVFRTIQTPQPAGHRYAFSVLWPFCHSFRANAKERGAADS
jgi:hypothetical protein